MCDIFPTNQECFTFTAIAYFESTWGARKGPNRNTDGSTDNGLLQLNSYLCCSESGNNKDCCCPGTYPSCRFNVSKRTCPSECGISCSTALTNDIVNTNCAYKHYRQGGCGGFKCWAGYNNHVTECNSFNPNGGSCNNGHCCSSWFPGSTCCNNKDGTHGCCTSPNTVCCSDGCCQTGTICCGTSCCPSNYPICCPNGCCPSGTHCCGNNQCCNNNDKNIYMTQFITSYVIFNNTHTMKKIGR